MKEDTCEKCGGSGSVQAWDDYELTECCNECWGTGKVTVSKESEGQDK